MENQTASSMSQGLNGQGGGAGECQGGGDAKTGLGVLRNSGS